MRIRIDFTEAVKQTFLRDWFYKTNNTELMNITGEEIKQIIIDDYFNGADLAVVYIGYSLDNEYFEFDLIPS